MKRDLRKLAADYRVLREVSLPPMSEAERDVGSRRAAANAMRLAGYPPSQANMVSETDF